MKLHQWLKERLEVSDRFRRAGPDEAPADYVVDCRRIGPRGVLPDLLIKVDHFGDVWEL